MSNLITRREVLQAGAALGVAPLLPLAEWSPPQKGGSFAYFSDTHVTLKRNVAECRAMLEELGKLYQPAFAINGGDVVEYGWKGEYESYATVLSGFPWKTHHIPGNHDVRWSPLGHQIFKEQVGKPFQAFEAMGCKFLLLDSSVPLSHWGHFESQQLRWAERELRNVGREQPVIVATHHWVGRDQVMVDNETTLMRVLEPYNVKLILTGHGHSDLLWSWDGALCTMNKGLYQGSYQRVDVDWEQDKLRLFRRTTQRPELSLLAEVPLRAPRENRKLWRVPHPEITAGAPLELRAEGAKQTRWDDGPWKTSPDTAGLLPGTHLLTLRTGEKGRYAAFPIHVKHMNDKLRELWRTKLPGGVMSHLQFAQGKLFVSCMDGSVLCIAPSTGKEVWRATTEGYCHSSPATDAKTVVVGSADGDIYAFDLSTGRKKWSYPTGGPVYASAAIAKDIAMIGSGDGKIYGIDLLTGKQRWIYELPKSDTAFTQSVPQTDGKRFYFGAWDKYTYALDVATGGLAWRQLCTASTFAYSPAIGGPAMGPEAIYIPANGNELYAFRKTDGEQLWKYSSPGDKVGYSAPCLVGDRIYIGCLGDKGEARCVSAADGKEVWCANVGAVIYDSSPAYSEGFVAVGSVDGVLHIIDSKDGSIFTQYQMPTGHFLSSPAMDDKRVYAATFSDELVALEINGSAS